MATTAKPHFSTTHTVRDHTFVAPAEVRTLLKHRNRDELVARLELSPFTFNRYLSRHVPGLVYRRLCSIIGQPVEETLVHADYDMRPSQLPASYTKEQAVAPKVPRNGTGGISTPKAAAPRTAPTPTYPTTEVPDQDALSTMVHLFRDVARENQQLKIQIRDLNQELQDAKAMLDEALAQPTPSRAKVTMDQVQDALRKEPDGEALLKELSQRLPKA